MKIKRTVTIFLLWISLFGQAFSAGLQIKNVSATSQVIQLPKDKTVDIRFHLNAAAEVTLIIYDARDYEIKRIQTQAPTAGDHTLTWDIRTDRGRVVPAGAYRYVIKAANAQGEVTHDLSDITGGESVIVDTIKVDPQTAEVHYQLPHSSRLFIRYGIADGPMLGTLLNGVVRTAGVHRESWSGWDANRHIHLAKHPKLEFYAQAYRLSRNALIVHKPGSAHMQPEWIDTHRHTPKRKSQARPLGLDRHAYHSREQCQDFEITLTPLHVTEHTKAGLPIVYGATPFRVELSAEDAAMVEAQRFEVSYFLDNQLLYENEISYSPYTWTWKPQGLESGEYHMTAFVLSYGGHFGTVTQKFRLQKQAPGKHKQKGHHHEQ